MNVSESDAAYDAWLASLTARQVEARFRDLGVEVVSVKRLAPNNNSKNQIYLQADINDVELPMGKFESHVSTSKKDQKASGPVVIYRAPLDLCWLTRTGISPAPGTNLIHYPQYPETRLSGFLNGARVAPRTLLSHTPGKVFSPDRIMLLGATEGGSNIYGLVLPPDSPAAQELTARLNPAPFARWTLTQIATEISNDTLLSELHGVHALAPIAGCTISRDGIVVPNRNPNSGGTTLETVLGVRPNARSEPDFHGWELKSHSTSKITLMTPGPTGGYLIDHGVEAFMRQGKFGYWSHKSGRYNYTGAHTALRAPRGQATTHMVVDPISIHLVHNQTGEVGMTWAKAKLLDKWTAKHALAAYVERSGNAVEGFTFGHRVGLGVGTSFVRFLDAVEAGEIYFDPALHWSPSGIAKWRYQIRVHRNRLDVLYDKFIESDVRTRQASRTLAEADLRVAGLILPAWLRPPVP